MFRMFTDYKGMLQNYMPRMGYENTQGLAVLNMACGKCFEAEVLFELFGDKITGVDKDSEEISELLERIGSDKGKFVAGTEKSLKNILDEKVEVVIARHPNVFGDNWKKIYRECNKFTKKEGIIISTFYTEPDYLMGENLIEQSGYRVLISEENPFGIIYSDSFVSSGEDRYIVMGKKGNSFIDRFKAKISYQKRILQLAKKFSF